MKTILLFTFSIICISAQSQTTFQEMFFTNDPKGNTLKNGIATQDGGYILITDGGTSHKSITRLTKLDAFGKVQWSKSISSDIYAFSQKIIQTKDGGYAIAGYETQPSSGNHYDMRLVKLGAAGNIQWAKLYRAVGGQNTQANCIVQKANGDFILAGDITTKTNGSIKGFILETDNNGTLVSSNRISLVGSTLSSEIGSFILTSDGGAAFTFGGALYPSDNIALIKIAKTGNIQWAKKILDTVTFSEFTRFVIETSDKGFLFGGYGTFYYGSEYNDNIIVAKTNSLGEKKWMEAIGTDNVSRNDAANDAIELPDSTYVLAGNTAPMFQSFGQPYLVTLNSKGKILNTKIMDLSPANTTSVIKSKLGGFAVAGSLTNESNPYFFKFDDSGNTCSPVDTAGSVFESDGFSDVQVSVSPVIINTIQATDSVQNYSTQVTEICSDNLIAQTQSENLTNKIGLQFSIYNNPVKDKLSLQLNSTNKNQIQIQITSTSGEVVLKDLISLQNNLTKNYDVHSLQKGVYYLTVSNGINVYHKTFIKD